MSHLKKHPLNSVDDHIGVLGAVQNNFMSFDVNNLPQDAGVNASSFATTTHTHTLDSLLDTNLTALTNNEIISYDFVTSTWINKTFVEAGIAPTVHTHVAADITDFDTEVTNNTTVQSLLTDSHVQNTDTSLDLGGTNPVTASEIRNFIDSKALNNGLAPLDASGIIPAIHLPASILGALNYKGTWNATTNIPALGNLGAGGVQGDYYVVSVAGTTSVDGVTDYNIGDWITNNGTSWEKIDNTDGVSSVNSQVGAIVLNTDDISEGITNLYYTDARVSANVNVAANTLSSHTQNTDTQLRSGLIDTDASGNMLVTGELNIKTYVQASEPVLHADQYLAMWIDTSDNNATYLVFRLSVGVQKSVELA